MSCRLYEIPNHDEYSYPVLPDDVNVPNNNAFILSSMCKEFKLLLLNNLKTPMKHYVSGKTSEKVMNGHQNCMYVW